MTPARQTCNINPAQTEIPAAGIAVLGLNWIAFLAIAFCRQAMILANIISQTGNIAIWHYIKYFPGTESLPRIYSWTLALI